jgi:hypothetical protein
MMVASNQTAADHVVADTVGVYWSTSNMNGAIVGITGTGAALTLASNQGTIEALALSASAVVWQVPAKGIYLVHRGADGGPSVPFSSSAKVGKGIAANSDTIYYGDGNYLAGCPFNGCTGGAGPFTLAPCLTAHAPALFGTTVFALCAANGGTLLSAAITGGGGNNLATGIGDPVAMAADAERAYWGDPNSGAIVSALRTADGGAPAQLVSSRGTVSAIAVDDTFVYWATSNGYVMAARKANGATTTLAQGQANPSSVAVGGAFVYWTNTTAGTVMKTPHP